MNSVFRLHIFPLLSFLVVLSLSTTSLAQSGDYLITLKNDTLTGELKLLFYGPEKKVQIKANNEKNVYSILETKELHYDGDVYHPVKGPEGYTFMKLITPGYLSLYHFSTDNRTTMSSEFLLKADGSSLEVPNLGFKKQMSNFLSDCDGVSTRIDQGELSKKDLDQIINEYNYCIELKTHRLEQSIARRMNRVEKSTPWDGLEKKITEQSDFDGKDTALEMVADIKNRIAQGEKVPNYIIEGLKKTLESQSTLQDSLNKAIAEIK